jgi:S1-C subfamily serine protease
MDHHLLSLSNELAAAVEHAGRAVVSVNARRRLPSTGVHWSPGLVVTANHTVQVDEGITITTADGHGIPATLTGRDPGTDLALLRFDASGLPCAEIADSDAARVGHLVLAIGAGPSASLGVISALGGPWGTPRGGRVDRLLSVDLTLYPGFSGGPLIDTQGRVVGINTSGLARLRLAIPSSTVSRVADEIARHGRVARGYLGLGMQPVRLPEETRRTVALAGDHGLIVINVEPDGPAARAGVLLGDVLVSLDGHSLDDVSEVQAVLARHPVGAAVGLTVVRAGKVTELRVTLGERPERRRR